MVMAAYEGNVRRQKESKTYIIVKRSLKDIVEVKHYRGAVVCLQICLNFDCNLPMLSGTSPCVSNRRAGRWETAGRNPDGADVSFFFTNTFPVNCISSVCSSETKSQELIV